MMIRRDSIIWEERKKYICFSYVTLLIENRHEVVTIAMTLSRMVKFAFIHIISQ